MKSFSSFQTRNKKVKQLILAAIFRTTLECYEPNKVKQNTIYFSKDYFPKLPRIKFFLCFRIKYYACSHQQQQPGASYCLLAGGHHQQHQQQQQHNNYHSNRQPSQARPGQFANHNNFNKIKKVDPSNMSSYETNPVGALQVMVVSF